jgi:hypothetical protein
MRRIALLLVIALCGCGGSGDQKIVGEWQGKFQLDTGKSLPGANMTFDADHHFRELFKNLEINGSWRLDGKKLMFTTERIGNRTVDEYRKMLLASKDPKLSGMAAGLDKPAVFTLSDDGKTLVGESTAGSGGHAEYTKQ